MLADSFFVQLRERGWQPQFIGLKTLSFTARGKIFVVERIDERRVRFVLPIMEKSDDLLFEKVEAAKIASRLREAQVVVRDDWFFAELKCDFRHVDLVDSVVDALLATCDEFLNSYVKLVYKNF